MQMNPIDKHQGDARIPIRNFVTALVAKTGEKLFGGLNVCNAKAYPGAFTVPDGDTRAFLAARLVRSGVPEIEAQSSRIDAAIIAAAQRFAKAIEGTAGEKAMRIAIEYVASSCVLSPEEVEPFSTYAEHSLEYRKAVKAINGATALSERAMFAGNDRKRFREVNGRVAKAWGTIAQLLAISAHLRALRTAIATPLLFANEQAWARIQVLDPTLWDPITSTLQAIVNECGNPFVTANQVEEALCRYQGTRLLSTGNAYGVSAEAVIDAIAKDRAIRGNRNGGPELSFADASAAAIGAAIGGLYGTADGQVVAVRDDAIEFRVTVREGASKRGTVNVPLPLPLPANGGQRWAN